MRYSYNMRIKVEVELTTSPQEKHLKEMGSAAREFTDDVESVKVSISTKNPGSPAQVVFNIVVPRIRCNGG